MSQPAAGVRVTINGRSVEVAPGTLVVEAARRAGVHIPVFCYHPRLKPAGVCRMCLVRVQGQPRLVTACTTPVADGMVVDTRDPEALAAQRSVVEFLLLNHPLDCPVCDKGGECDLQDLTFKYGPAISRLADPKLRRPKAVELGPFIVLDQERCILCRRCVRFDDEVAQERQLVIEERAVGSVVTTAAGRPYQHPFTGNVVELCPVGALTARTYRFRARPWDLSPVASACTVCSVHCPARFDVRLGQLVRVVSPGGYMDHLFGAPGLMSAYHTPADDVPGAQGMGWLCDRGRFNHGYLHSPQRLAGPLAGRGPLKRALDWEQALQRAEDLLARAVEEHGPQAVGILGGGRLFWEEAVALARLARVLGTPHVDYRTAGQAVASLATPSGRSGRVEDLERASAVVVVGSPPVERAPVLDLAVRAALARGARVYAAGPCRPPYRASGVEFRPAWGQELAQWLRELAGVLAEAPGPVVVVWDGDGAWDGRAGLVGEALLELAETVERAGRQVGLLVPGAHPQARAAEAAGLVPGEGGLDTAGMLQALAAGELKALYVVGANPLATFPDRALVEQALAAAEAVIVQDLLPTETVQQADLVLACVPAPMRQGTLVDLDGRVRVHAMVVPPDGRGRPDGEILQELARRLARRLGRSLEPDQEGGPASPGAAAPLSGDGVAALEPARARRLWA
ncbi:MAG TPA: molybdopterin-dependent oxidoreductase, partial [Limnochordales bacterium]